MQTKTKPPAHTPRHWGYAPTAGHETHGQSAVYDANGKDIAIVYDGDAHAALIAAAPALLAALKYVEGRLPAHDTKAINQARAAIAKATETEAA